MGLRTLACARTSLAQGFETDLDGHAVSAVQSHLGVVPRPGLILLFVTLDKTGMHEEHRYEDAFVSPTEFRWQSQNRTARESRAGQMIKNHQSAVAPIGLAVREPDGHRVRTDRV